MPNSQLLRQLVGARAQQHLHHGQVPVPAGDVERGAATAEAFGAGVAAAAATRRQASQTAKSAFKLQPKKAFLGIGTQ